MVHLKGMTVSLRTGKGWLQVQEYKKDPFSFVSGVGKAAASLDVLIAVGGIKCHRN